MSEPRDKLIVVATQKAAIAKALTSYKAQLVSEIEGLRIVSENSNQQYYYDHEDKTTGQQGFNKALDSVISIRQTHE